MRAEQSKQQAKHKTKISRGFPRQVLEVPSEPATPAGVRSRGGVLLQGRAPAVLPQGCAPVFPGGRSRRVGEGRAVRPVCDSGYSSSLSGLWPEFSNRTFVFRVPVRCAVTSVAGHGLRSGCKRGHRLGGHCDLLCFSARTLSLHRGHGRMTSRFPGTSALGVGAGGLCRRAEEDGRPGPGGSLGLLGGVAVSLGLGCAPTAAARPRQWFMAVHTVESCIAFIKVWHFKKKMIGNRKDSTRNC